MKKVGKTNRPFRYDLNQIPYDCTVEVRNRFKGLDLIHTMPEELWMEVWDIVQEVVIKTIPQKNKCQKQNGSLRRPYNRGEKRRSKRQKRKTKIYPFECRVPKTARRNKKAFLSEKCKEIEENNRVGKTRDLDKKIRDREHFM